MRCACVRGARPFGRCVCYRTGRYVGNLPGDPRGGATRCLTNNVFSAGFGGTTAYFCGVQPPGRPLVVDEADPASRGMVDWGTFSRANNGRPGVGGLVANGAGAYKMARVLSPASANQVSAPGRKVITAWIDLGSHGQAAALPRDLSLDPATGELLQVWALCLCRSSPFFLLICG